MCGVVSWCAWGPFAFSFLWWLALRSALADAAALGGALPDRPSPACRPVQAALPPLIGRKDRRELTRALNTTTHVAPWPDLAVPLPICWQPRRAHWVPRRPRQARRRRLRAKPPTLGPLNLELRWAASGPAAWTLTVLANGPLPGMRRPGCFAQCLAALAPRPSLLEAGALMRACGTIWMTMPLALFKAPSLLHTWLPTT